jgi:DNA repair ATPase RecN
VLEEIRIENLGVISGAHARLAPGLTVITGETGAGKTMVLTGLGLLLGGRADPGSVRSGSPSASVEGRVTVAPDSPVLARAREAGAEPDEDGGLILVRTVAAEGRSRAFLGGRSVPQVVLADLADDLVTVHGQADQARLRSPARQRDALDTFAGADLLTELAEYREQWALRMQLVKEIDDLSSRRDDVEREAALLRRGLDEIERVSPRPGEDVELAAEAERLDTPRTCGRPPHRRTGVSSARTRGPRRSRRQRTSRRLVTRSNTRAVMTPCSPTLRSDWQRSATRSATCRPIWRATWTTSRRTRGGSMRCTPGAPSSER